MDDFITVTATGISITTGAASAGASIPLMSSGEVPRYVRVAATVAAHVRFGKTSATAVATDALIQPGDSQVFHIPSGYDYVAAIQNASSGKVIVTPMENM